MKIAIDTGASFTRIWNGKDAVQKLRTPSDYNAYLTLLHKSLSAYETIECLVVALPGIIENNRIIKAPNLSKNWEGKDIAVDICKVLKITGKIHVVQDTEAAAYGTQNQDLFNLEPTILITLSSGVGAALITGDRVLPLEVGHMPLNLSGQNYRCGCGQLSCVEADLSGSAIRKRTDNQPELLQDPTFWYNYGKELGQLFLTLVPLFKLKQIIVMGGISEKHEFFIHHATQYMIKNLKYVPMPLVRVTSLGDAVGVIGAFSLIETLKPMLLPNNSDGGEVGD